MKILIVDDDETFANAVGLCLEKQGYEVVTANNGQEAVGVLRQERLDLILTDFMMPSLNGIELTRTVKSNPNWFETKIVVMSYNTRPEFRMRSIQLGAIDYLNKGDGPDPIVRRIHSVLARKPSGSATESEQRPLSSSFDKLLLLSDELIEILGLGLMLEDLSMPARGVMDSARKVAEKIRDSAEIG